MHFTGRGSDVERTRRDSPDPLHWNNRISNHCDGPSNVRCPVSSERRRLPRPARCAGPDGNGVAGCASTAVVRCPGRPAGRAPDAPPPRVPLRPLICGRVRITCRSSRRSPRQERPRMMTQTGLPSPLLPRRVVRSRRSRSTSFPAPGCSTGGPASCSASFSADPRPGTREWPHSSGCRVPISVFVRRTAWRGPYLNRTRSVCASAPERYTARIPMASDSKNGDERANRLSAR